MGWVGSLVRNLSAARNGMASFPIKLLGALRSFALGPASPGKLSSCCAAANCCEPLCEAVPSENDKLNWSGIVSEQYVRMSAFSLKVEFQRPCSIAQIAACVRFFALVLRKMAFR